MEKEYQLQITVTSKHISKLNNICATTLKNMDTLQDGDKIINMQIKSCSPTLSHSYESGK